MRCLWCNEKGRRFYSTKAAQRHMLDKGHCKIAHETSEDLLEFEDFYDFTASYPDGDHCENEEPVEVMQITDTDEDGFLKLPSGDTIGHRALARYFRFVLFSSFFAFILYP